MAGKFSWKILVPGIPVTTSVGFLGLSNVSLIETEGHYIIFDTGHYGIRDYLIKALEDEGLKTGDIDYVVLSHLHFDHALNAPLFKNAKFFVSSKELEYIEKQGDKFEVEYLPQLLKDKIVTVDEGQELHGLKFIMLPGHTGGSMGIISEDGVLFTGDAIRYFLDAYKKEVSLALYDINEANKSIRKALKIAKIIVPGHDIPFAVENGVPKRLPDFRANDFKISLYGEINISLLQFCCISQLSF
jgi:glyoxylase-like metal-dependent hydrolase (beta-lactamase superfamily II)